MKKLIVTFLENLMNRRGYRTWKKLVTFLAAVVVFCTTYALILPAITLGQKPVCGREEHVHTEECRQKEYQLVCTQEHVHTEACYAVTEVPVCGKEEHTHTEECYSGAAENEETPKEADISEGEEIPEEDAVSDENAVSGQDTAPDEETVSEGKDVSEEEGIPDGENISGEEQSQDPEGEETKEETSSYTYEDESVLVSVTLGKEHTVPEDAVLRVELISDSDERCESLEQQAETLLQEQMRELRLYDVSFYTSHQEYLPVTEEADVVFHFKKPVIEEAEGEIVILHYEEGAELPRTLSQVGEKRDEEQKLQTLSFQTEGFSVFGVAVLAAERQQITYQLNVPQTDVLEGVGNESLAGKWQGGTPSMALSTQSISGTKTALYSVSGDRTADGYFVNAELATGTTDVTQNDVKHINKYLKEQGEPYGKEYQFRGWSAEKGGETYLFPEGASAYVDDAGMLTLTDCDGIERKFSGSLTLTGVWRKVSDICMFYVNYGGTILEHEGDVSGRRDESSWTNCLGIGRIYF